MEEKVATSGEIMLVVILFFWRFLKVGEIRVTSFHLRVGEQDDVDWIWSRSRNYPNSHILIFHRTLWPVEYVHRIDNSIVLVFPFTTRFDMR